MLTPKSKITSSKQIQNSKFKTVFRISFKRLIFSVILCLGFGALNLLFSPQVSAKEAISLIVSPPHTDVEGKPGEIVQKNIKVTNGSEDQELILSVYTKDFLVTDDLGTPIPVEKTLAGRYLASPWFTLEKSELVIPPKGSEQIVVLINIPKDALPGGHYAGVFFQPIPSRGIKKTVSYTTSQVGSLFAITVPGDIKYTALIKEFKTKLNVFEFGPIDFTAVIENQSDTHISPKINLTVKDSFGRTVADVPVDAVNIFPYTARTLQARWETVWGLGRYSATISATYGPSLLATRTLYFWIMPYRLLTTVSIIILVLVAVFILVRRHLKYRSDHRDEEIEELKRKIIEMENHQP